MIQLQVIGFLGKDAEQKQPGDKTVINFSVAHNYSANGVKYTQWIQCAWWEPPPEMLKRLTAGTQVWVMGAPYADSYKRGTEMVVILKVNVDRCEVINAQKVGADRFAAMRMPEGEPEAEAAVEPVETAVETPAPAPPPKAKKARK